MAERTVPENTLFVCAGCMSNLGALSVAAGLEAVQRAGPERAGVLSLTGLATGVSTIIEATQASHCLIGISGCSLNCAERLLKLAGYTADYTVSLETDAHIEKQVDMHYAPAEFERAVASIMAALH
jgi:uncharacterized metal-binding protein